MAKVVTMGEIMLRLSTQGFNRFIQSESFDVYFGGGEANVAVSLAHYGHDAYFVTKLPKNEIGEAAVKTLISHRVKSDFIMRGGERIGIYYLENGTSIRPSKVIYDRSNSAISLAHPEEFDFDLIFKDVKWFHWSGITPAISKNAAELIKIACIAAKKAGAVISVDLNYRKKLWTPKEAKSVMKELMQYVDICIANEEDLDMVLGYKPKNTDILLGKLDVDSYKVMLKEINKDFGFKMIATTLRESYSASKNGWSALLYDGSLFYQSKHYIIDPIIDRIGAGDAFSGGLIHGLLTRKTQEALEFAVAASALKHTILGDFNLVSEDEVDQLKNGNASGRVDR